MRPTRDSTMKRLRYGQRCDLQVRRRLSSAEISDDEAARTERK